MAFENLPRRTSRQELRPQPRNAGPVVQCNLCGMKNRLSLVAGKAVQKCGQCKAPLPRNRVILCDVSSSMAEFSGERRKIDILAEALQQVLARMEQWVLIAFSSFPTRIESVNALPSPNGGTALHLALEEAYEFAPERTLVISDGQPDSEEDALTAAEELTGRIDVIYVGPDDDVDALDFMRSLARQSGGELVVEDLEEDDYEDDYADDYEDGDARKGLIESIQRLLLPGN